MLHCSHRCSGFSNRTKYTLHAFFMAICSCSYPFLPAELSSTPVSPTFSFSTSSTITSIILCPKVGGSDPIRLFFSQVQYSHQTLTNPSSWTPSVPVLLREKHYGFVPRQVTNHCKPEEHSSSPVTTFQCLSTSSTRVVKACNLFTLRTYMTFEGTFAKHQPKPSCFQLKIFPLWLVTQFLFFQRKLLSTLCQHVVRGEHCKCNLI